MAANAPNAPRAHDISDQGQPDAALGRSRILSPDHWREAVAFHGHECPGLAIGFKAVEAAIGELGLDAARLPVLDEELVCITENDACGVDAIQCLLGCTYGKSNLIPRLRGKMAFTFYVREPANGRLPASPVDPGAAPEFAVGPGDAPEFVVGPGDAPEFVVGSETTPEPEIASRTAHPRAIRVYLKDDLRGSMSRDEYQIHLLESPYHQLFAIEAPRWPLPEAARHFDSQPCARCGELTAEYALRLQDGAPVCLDCYQPYDREGF